MVMLDFLGLSYILTDNINQLLPEYCQGSHFFPNTKFQVFSRCLFGPKFQVFARFFVPNSKYKNILDI